MAGPKVNADAQTALEHTVQDLNSHETIKNALFSGRPDPPIMDPNASQGMFQPNPAEKSYLSGGGSESVVTKTRQVNRLHGFSDKDMSSWGK